MIHNNNTWFGAICGIVGGSVDWLLKINMDSVLIDKLIDAGTVALVCGFLGAAGHRLYGYVDKQIKKITKKKK